MKCYIIIMGIICLLGYHIKVNAQVFPKEKRIYLVDVTASMKGKGIVETPDIFEKVKSELTSAVKSIYTKDTDITIIPFTNVPHQPIIGNSNNKDSLIAEIDKLSIMKGDTNIADAWNELNLDTDQVYINAHGTGTPLNDKAETIAIKKALGEKRARKVLISSTKSMTGHMFGAAGAAEAIASVLALQHQMVPPTIGLAQPDPECDLDYVPLEARKADIQAALSTSLGFGGHNACIAFRKIGGDNQ